MSSCGNCSARASTILYLRFKVIQNNNNPSQDNLINTSRSASYISNPHPHTRYNNHLMRFPSFPIIVRTFYTLTNATSRVLPASQKAIAPFARGTVLKSMPTIPLLGSLFSSSSSSKDMSYPIQKSDEEWQAQLNPGNYLLLKTMKQNFSPCSNRTFRLGISRS